MRDGARGGGARGGGIGKRTAPLSLALYIVGGCLIFILYRTLFSGSSIPLPPYRFSWPLTIGLMDAIDLFPALALSALIVPFGFSHGGEESAHRFSPKFLETMAVPVLTAVAAATLYGLLTLLVHPVLLDYRKDMALKGDFFAAAMERASAEAEQNRWREAAQHMAICEKIWPNSPKTEQLRDRIVVGLDQVRLQEQAGDGGKKGAPGPWMQAPTAIPGQRKPMDAADALQMAEQALADERPYDAHWMANLANRIAKPGSPEAAQALLTASKAWNSLAALEPNRQKMGEYAAYQRKREGYAAVVSEDWIKGYYIYKELAGRYPTDPDIEKYLALSKEGMANIVFFVDEVPAIAGNVETDLLVSLPRKSEDGRTIGRGILDIQSAALLPDASYAVGLSYMGIDMEGEEVFRVEAPYAKFTPYLHSRFDPEQDAGGQEQKTLVRLTAMDKDRQSPQWKASWSGKKPIPAEQAQLMLDIPYEDLRLVAQARHGVRTLSMIDLLEAERRLENYGYAAEVFRTELIRRIANPFAFLSLGVFAIAFGWRLRAKKPAGLVGIAMVLVLPLVFSALTQAMFLAGDTMNTWLVLSLPFVPAAMIYLGAQLALFLGSLVFLAGQRG